MTQFSLQNFLPYKLSILSQTVSRLIAQEYGTRFNLTMHQWRCLVIISTHQDITAKDICTHTLLDKMTVSRVISTLVKRKLIKLSPSPNDARKQLITRTTTGRLIYEDILPIAQEYEASLLSALTLKERKELDSTIKKLILASDTLKFDK